MRDPIGVACEARFGVGRHDAALEPHADQSEDGR